jgi:ABC-type sugar transport system permease subunit
MTARRRRHALAAVIWIVLVSASVLGYVVSAGRVERARHDLLAAEAATAAELVGETGGTAVLDAFVPDRWRTTLDIDRTIDRAVVAVVDGRAEARAALYDADGWARVGTVVVRQERRDRGSRNLFLMALAAVLVLPPVLFWTRGARHAWIAAATAFGVLAFPLVRVVLDARQELAQLTDRRVATAVTALQLVDPYDVAGRPGGVYRLTGLPFVVLDSAGGAAFSSLPTAATEEFVPAAVRGMRPRLEADAVTYAVGHVGPALVAVLPYDDRHDPAAPVGAIGLVAIVIAAFVASLASLVDRPRALRRNLVAWTFVAPSFVHLAAFTIGPLLFALWLSLHQWSLLDAARPFVGIANYLRLLRDGAWWNAVANTAVFTLHVPVAMAAALALALLVHRRARGIVALRALFFLPSITSLVAIAIAWQWMLHDEYGLINAGLSLLGLGPVPWLTSPETALLAIMLMSVWLVVGYQMVLFQAGLAAIPQDLYDAAKIDGAGAWRRFLHVTLPGLRHTLFFVLVTSVIGSFQVFGAVYVMTEGGPLHATDVAVFHIYEEAWEFFRFGDAAAMSWVLFAIIFVVTWLQFRTVERRIA